MPWLPESTYKLIQQAAKVSGLPYRQAVEAALRDFIAQVRGETKAQRRKKEAAKKKRADALRAWHQSLTPEARKDLARKRAQARWGKGKKREL